jgi:hypothetical protein
LKELNIENTNDFSVEKRMLRYIDIISNKIPFFNDDEKIIIGNGSISFARYKQVLSIETEQEININEFVKAKVDTYINNFNELLSCITGKEDEQNRIKTEILELDALIKSLCANDQELKDLLTETLKYINNTDVDIDTSISCPICNSNFDKGILLEKVNSKLIEQNEAISSLMNKRNDLEKNLKEHQLIISNIYTQYIEKNIAFLNILEMLKNGIVLIGQMVSKETNDYNANLVKLNQERISLTERFSNIIIQIDELNFPKVYSELNGRVIEELNKIIKGLEDRGFKLEALNVNQIADIISTCNQRINLFEQKLNDNNIKINNIEDDLLDKLNNCQIQLDKFDNIADDINAIEEKTNEVYLELNNSERLKEVTKLQIDLSEQEKLILRYDVVLKNMEKSTVAATNAIQKISENILTQHQKFISAIYKRINPHPLYSDVEFNFNKNSRGSDILNISCINTESSESVNPAFTFSSAQVNVVAVSIFLGMALRQQCSNLRTIMLDDPIQNMDDLNVIAFIDILRNYLDTDNNFQTKKQIIISTHDQDFYKIMMKKFRFIKKKAFEFIGYSEIGPMVM